jgi:hypothetical protein
MIRQLALSRRQVGLPATRASFLPHLLSYGRTGTSSTGNAPQFDLRTELFRITGTDLTQIDGIDVVTATTILSEVGWDMSKWQAEHHFVSWLRLCPQSQWGQDHWERAAADQQSNYQCVENGSQQLTDEQHLCGSAVPSTQNQAGGSGGHQGHGSQASPLALPHAAPRHAIRFYETQHRNLQIAYRKRKAAKLGFRITELAA